MSATAPWSVKGIDPKAREIAKDLARRSGMTLGEWINSMIMDEPEEDGVVAAPRRASAPDPYDRRGRRRRLDDAYEGEGVVEGLISEMGERLEAAERRSATAIQGIDQAVSSLMRRLDAERDLESQRERRLENMSRELREGHQRLKSIEAHSGANGAAEVVGLKDRLDQAEGATRTALEALQQSFSALEKRLGQIEARPALGGGELTQLADGLRQQIESNRQDLIARLGASSDGSRLDRIEQTFDKLLSQSKDAEMRSANAVEAMGHEVMRIARNMNTRMQTLEQEGVARSEVMDQRLAELGRVLDEKLDREIARTTSNIETRLTRQEDQHALALERLGGEITRISDRLSERITQTERRSSQAIDDISRRLAENTDKLERRSNDVSGELAERMRQSEERTLRLLEEAKAVRARRETAAQNASARLSTPLASDGLELDEVPPFIAETPAVSLFADTQSHNWSPQQAPADDWRTAALAEKTSPLDAPLAEAQASPSWADTVASEMAVEPFPTKHDFRPFGTLEGDLDDDLLVNELVAEARPETTSALDLETGADFGLEAEAAPKAASVAEPADGYPSIFASVLNEELHAQVQEALAGQVVQDDTVSDDDDLDPAAGDDFTAASTVDALFDAPLDALLEEAPALETEASEDEALQGADDLEAADDILASDDAATVASPNEYPLPVIKPQDFLEVEDFIPELAYQGQAEDEVHDPLAADGAFEDEGEDSDQTSDPFETGYISTRDAIESARAAISDELEGDETPRKTFGLNKLRKKGGTSALQQKLDRKATREGSTFGQALKVSALAMLVVGGGGYGTLKLVKDQNLDLNFGQIPPSSAEPSVPMAALALDATPVEAVPAQDVAATEGAALFASAITMIENGDATGLEPLQRAAELGYVPAQMRLAALYTEGGVGVQRNPTEAREWVRRAAEAGEPRAMQYYATQLYDGVGGARDERAAVEWMRKSAEAGSVDSQYNLAHLYENGVRGMSANKVEAFTWYMIAARRGDQQALQAVQRITQSQVLNASERSKAKEAADNFSVAPLS